MSRAMYDELIQPGHIRTIRFAKEHDMPVIMHSCGYVEPLLGGMIEAGIDCLQAIEVKAGMDLLLSLIHISTIVFCNFRLNDKTAPQAVRLQGVFCV